MSACLIVFLTGLASTLWYQTKYPISGCSNRRMEPYLNWSGNPRMTSTDQLAAAMLRLAIAGSPKKTLKTELNALARESL